jgi:translation initiation factor 5B
VFAVARDGVLPLSGWIGKVDASGQPKNAVTVMYIFGACILCTIIPSQVAFTSLVSASGAPTIAAYGLISILRLIMTRNRFKSSYFRLGKFGVPFYVCAAGFNAVVFAVSVYRTFDL